MGFRFVSFRFALFTFGWKNCGGKTARLRAAAATVPRIFAPLEFCVCSLPRSFHGDSAEFVFVIFVAVAVAVGISLFPFSFCQPESV